MRKLILDSLVVGMALFAMFFGAGNIIFPPYIGLGAGADWYVGFLGYFISDIGLAVLTIFAILRSDSVSRNEGLMYRLGGVPATLMMGAIVLCIGPLLAVPRTAATAFQIGMAPYTGDGRMASAVFTAVFFLVVLAFSIRESKMVDIVGKYLTPIKFFGLLLIIGGGILFPIGPINPVSRIENVPLTGVIAGYQTMDVLAALMFGVIIVRALKAKGHDSPKAMTLSVVLASIIASVLLLIVYAGLCYLGATASTLYPMDVDRGHLVVLITQGIFGAHSVILLGVIVSVSCLATAIALCSTTGSFFSRLSKGRLSYNMVVVAVCVFSAVVANFGLTSIINFAVPILTVIYPGALVVVAMTFLDRHVYNDNIVKFAAAGAMLVSLLEVLNGFGAPFAFIQGLPLSSLGFGWVIPAILCANLGIFVKPRCSGAVKLQETTSGANS